MDLILWRHADAENLTHFQRDTERQLTAKGHKQADKMGWWLDQVLPKHCEILVSPSQRTVQTALALGRQFQIVEEVGTSTNTNKILSICNWPHNKHPVLVIGHQPHLGQVVSKVIPTMQNVSVQKANVWWISQNDADEYAGAFLKAVMTPDLITKKMREG